MHELEHAPHVQDGVNQAPVTSTLAGADSLQEASKSPLGPLTPTCSRDSISQGIENVRSSALGMHQNSMSSSSTDVAFQRHLTNSSEMLDLQSEVDTYDSQSPRGLKRMRTSSHENVPVVARRQQGSFRGLCPEGEKSVEGFEMQGLRVAAKCGKKLPKTQSWCFVPLIYSALGRVPDFLWREGIASAEQIEAAQPNWSRLFSHWQIWCSELRKKIEAYGVPRFERNFLPRSLGNVNSWTTSMVYGEPRTFGRLPHPQGQRQDAILNMLASDTQNQIFASIIAITTG